jgi:single-strand DNA-binding protein
MGRLTRDPELRHTQGAEPKAVARFALAVDRNYTKPDGKRDTDFFEIETWRQKAEFVSKFYKKGQLVCVEGRLQREDWTDKDGVKRTSYRIVADNCYFAEGKKTETTTNNGDASESVHNDFDPFADGQEPQEDLPF